MTIGMTAQQGKRWGILAIAATLGCLGDAAQSRAADGPGILDRKPNGPIFKTLDAFAGGIELVLEKTVLSHSKPKRGCDSHSCDDGCDAILLHELNMPRGSKIAVPEAYRPLSPAEPPLHSRPSESTPSESRPSESGPRMIQVEPTFDRPARKALPAPMPESSQMPVPKMEMPPVPRVQPPKPALLTIPKVPPDVKTPVQRKSSQPDLSTEDGWIDSFAPATPNPDAAPRLRAPVPANETLPDPFQDDPQARTAPQRFLPRSHPSGTTYTNRPFVRKSVEPVHFERSN